MHFNLYQPVAAAGLAAAALDIEGEPAGFVAAQPGVLGGGKKLANIRKQPRIGGRIRPGRTPDGALVDINDLIQIFQAEHTVRLPRPHLAVV